MSARLIRAIRSGKVVVKNRNNVEVMLRYVNLDKVKVSRYLAPREQVELAPKLCSPSQVKFSNVQDLCARGALSIVL